ncbi:sugar ABC transporter permease [Candidatus Bipolaricaulota bacterium]|nr:sugar ABC transporter permease [Candidatus Bipolaricaulota bacterium]
MNEGKYSSPLNDIAGRFTPYLYLAPTFIVVSMFLLYPLFNTFIFSFTKWSGLNEMKFVGLQNYFRLAEDPKFWSALTTNLIYILLFSVVPTVLGLVVASIIGRAEIKGARYFRTIFLTPQVVASVAIGTIFGWIYAPSFGVLNRFLESIGLSFLTRTWLGSSSTAPYAVGLIGTWIWTGFCIIIFLSGIQKINEDVYDAAKIDGASAWQTFFYVTLPQLRHELVVVFILTLIRALSTNVFGVVSAITGGAYNTRPISLYAYQLSFVQYEVGYASSVVVILALVIFTFSSITFLLEERGG